MRSNNLSLDDVHKKLQMDSDKYVTINPENEDIEKQDAS
jgi:hypothetical protein